MGAIENPIYEQIEKITYQAREEYDKFIFETIRPYSESVVQMEISKKDLEIALLLWKNYDHRLKSDLEAMLVDLQIEMGEYEPKWAETEEQIQIATRMWDDLDDILQKKIDSLKEPIM